MKTFLAAVAAAAVQGAESYGYGHPHYHTQTSSSYDPWTTTSTSTSTTGWYSPYQQYSPPKIAYKGGSSKVTEFAICQVYQSTNNPITITPQTSQTLSAANAPIGHGNALSATGCTQTTLSTTNCFTVGQSRLTTELQFAQAPGKTTSLNIKNFTNEGLFSAGTQGTAATPTTNAAAQSYEFRLMEYGQLLAGTGTTNNFACGNMGNQFRPLKEVDKYGRVNPFQDPNRGVIPAQSAGAITLTAATVTGNNGGDITDGTKVRNLLISLSGKDSIIGRGIAVYNKTPVSSTDSTLRGTRPVGCCVVALDVPPTVSVNHHHHYGYGGYGYGHGYSQPSYGHGYSSGSSHGHGYGSGHGYPTAANTSNSTHKHDYGHGNGIGSHSHSGHGSGYGGYSTGSHTHGTTTHSHEVGAPKVTASKSHDFFGGSKSGSSYFSNMAYQPSSRYSSRRY